ncbi:MAG: hypothetical protein RL300_224 [Pseudomonadota bacterium]|jgi:putative nucleotidyltransferase with HDIG domain
MSKNAVVFRRSATNTDFPYAVETGTVEQRQAVADWLAGLDQLSPEVREKVITAWVTVLCWSDFDTIEEVPYYPGVPGYRLADHVNDVTEHGMAMSETAAKRWGDKIDANILVSCLILHDVDKPLLFTKVDGKEGYTPITRQIPHGVLGGMLLKDIGFPLEVVATVTTHAGNMPFHAETVSSWVLHYADYFCADKVFLLKGAKPMFQRYRVEF